MSLRTVREILGSDVSSDEFARIYAYLCAYDTDNTNELRELFLLKDYCRSNIIVSFMNEHGFVFDSDGKYVKKK